MWQERQTFQFGGKSLQSLDSPLKMETDYISSFKYVTGIPLDPGHPLSDGTRVVTQKEGEERKTVVTMGGKKKNPQPKFFEAFVIGCNNGIVLCASVNEALVCTKSPHSNPPNRHQVIHRHHEDEGCYAVKVHEGMVASCGDKTIKVSHFFPVCGAEIVTIQLPQPVACRALLFWEGASHWTTLPGEEVALYLFSAHDDGMVRLWRIDVVAQRYEPIMTFSIQYPEYDESTKIHRQIRKPIRDLILDCDPGAPGAATRLIAASEGRWACWDLAAVAKSTFPPMDQAQSQMLSQALSTDASAVSGLRIPCQFGTVSDARPESKWLDTLVVAKSPFVVATAVTEAMKDLKEIESSTTLNKETIAAASDALGQLKGFKEKHMLVCSAAEIGAVANEPLKVGSHLFLKVLFPSLTNQVLWPACAVMPLQSPQLLANAHEHQAVYTLCCPRKGRFLSGGGDGRVSVWDWVVDTADRNTEKYGLKFNVKAHADLVKTIAVLRHPDILVSTGYDGFTKEWHLFDLPEERMFCARTLAVTMKDGTRRTGEAVTAGGGDNLSDQVVDGTSEASRLGISCADTFPAIGALFVSGVFEGIIRSYELTAVDTCELPPGWYYDGTQSVKGSGKEAAEWQDGDPGELVDGTFVGDGLYSSEQ